MCFQMLPKLSVAGDLSYSSLAGKLKTTVEKQTFVKSIWLGTPNQQ